MGEVPALGAPAILRRGPFDSYKALSTRPATCGVFRGSNTNPRPATCWNSLRRPAPVAPAAEDSIALVSSAAGLATRPHPSEQPVDAGFGFGLLERRRMAGTRNRDHLQIGILFPHPL